MATPVDLAGYGDVWLIETGGDIGDAVKENVRRTDPASLPDLVTEHATLTDDAIEDRYDAALDAFITIALVRALRHEGEDEDEAVPLVSPDEFGARLRATIARAEGQRGGDPRSPDAPRQQGVIARSLGMPWGRAPLTDAERERLRGMRERHEADDAE